MEKDWVQNPCYTVARNLAELDARVLQDEVFMVTSKYTGHSVYGGWRITVELVLSFCVDSRNHTQVPRLLWHMPLSAELS